MIMFISLYTSLDVFYVKIVLFHFGEDVWINRDSIVSHDYFVLIKVLLDLIAPRV